MKTYSICFSLSDLFTKYDTLYSYPYCCKGWNCILFYGLEIFYCVFIAHLLCSFVDGHVSFFHTLIIINNVPMSIGVHVSFPVSSNIYLSVELINPYINSIFNFLRNLHIVFHEGCIHLHFHQQYMRDIFFLHPFQHFLFIDFLMVAMLTGVRLFLIVVLVWVYLMRATEHIFICLLAICISLEKCPFRSSALPPFFFLFRVSPAAYGSSQARGWIGAVAANYTTATVTWNPRYVCDLQHGSRQHQILHPPEKPGIKLTSSRILVGFVSTVPQQELPLLIFFKVFFFILSYMSPLYILNINPLSVISFATLLN